MEIVVALIAGPLAGLATAIVLGRQSRHAKDEEARQRLLDKQENWKREDEVAERAAQAAQDLIESNREVATIARETATRTFAQLTQIHTLVNSNMTATMEDALVKSIALLASQEQILFMLYQAGEPTEDTLREIQTTKEDIARRRAELQDRLRQTKVADAQVEQTADGGLQAEWKEET